MAINAALTLLCLGFLAGFFLVVNFLEKPIAPVMTAPYQMREHESDLRWTHSQLQNFLKFFGAYSLSPVVLVAFFASICQAITYNFDVIAVMIALGMSAMCFVSLAQTGPAMRKVLQIRAYEEDLKTLSEAVIRLVRLHHAMFLGVIPLILAQLFLLFV